MANNNFKCHFCTICNGTGCIGQMPGMGGVNRNENFRLNCNGWEVCRKENSLDFVNFLERPITDRIPKISLAPITGAVENIGFEDEKEYYLQMFSAAHKVGIGICIGDGYPDQKLKYGIDAIKLIRKNDSNASAAIFIKPFSNSKILEHISLSEAKYLLSFCNNTSPAFIMSYVVIQNLKDEIDIDSYNISTMKNLITLEKKTPNQLIEIKKNTKLPFAIKGIFTQEDIELVKEVKPDIAYISNHGGRVETRIGSTAEFLQNNSEELKKYCGEVWVDGGIRGPLDIATAMALGANRILVGRPFVTAFCKNGESGLCQKFLEFS